MRLFVAVRLSEEMKKEITATMHELKKLDVKGKYVPADNLHLTLAFIGETTEPQAVKEALAAKGNQGLAGAARSVRDALDAAGIDYDHKKFVPHITLIRKASGSWKQAKAPKDEMLVKNIFLMKSEVKDGRRVYSEVGCMTAA